MKHFRIVFLFGMLAGSLFLACDQSTSTEKAQNDVEKVQVFQGAISKLNAESPMGTDYPFGGVEKVNPWKSICKELKPALEVSQVCEGAKNIFRGICKDDGENPDYSSLFATSNCVSTKFDANNTADLDDENFVSSTMYDCICNGEGYFSVFGFRPSAPSGFSEPRSEPGFSEPSTGSGYSEPSISGGYGEPSLPEGYGEPSL